MVWSSTAPDGTKSVKANETILQGNTTYTETELNKDHFWNIGADENGRHQFAQMPKSVTGAPPVPADPALGAGMDNVFYSKEKTAAEAPTQQDVQPFVKNGNDVMQLLGMKCCGVFDINQGTGAITTLYTHNVDTIVTIASGVYQIKFDNALPSTSYMVLGMGAKYDAGAAINKPLIVSLGSGPTTAAKTTTSFIIITTDEKGVLTRPLQVSFLVFGG